MPALSSEQSVYQDALPLQCSVISARVYTEVLETGAGQGRCSTTRIQRLFPHQQARALGWTQEPFSHDACGPHWISHQHPPGVSAAPRIVFALTHQPAAALVLPSRHGGAWPVLFPCKASLAPGCLPSPLLSRHMMGLCPF